MATIAKVKRASGHAYQAKIKRQGRIITTKTFKTKTAAREWARRLESDLEMEFALNDPGRRTLFNELCRQYVEHYNGRDHYRIKQVGWWEMQFGSVRLADIRIDQIRAALYQYEEGADRTPPCVRKPSTVNRMKAALSALFTFGIKQGLASKNPVRTIPAATENNQRIRYLSEDERLRLLRSCRASKWEKLYLLVLMALMTGARKGELLAIRWEQINFIDRTVTLQRTKNGQARVLTLPIPVVEELVRHRISEGLVFARRRGIGQGAAEPNGPWYKALEDAGIEGFRFHDLRHSAASYLAMGGASLLEIAEVLGHRSLQTTKRYAHLSIDHKQTLTDRLLGELSL